MKHHFFNQEVHENSIDRPVGKNPPWASMWLWRDIARMKPEDSKTVILSGPTFDQTLDLQKEVTALKLDLPDICLIGFKLETFSIFADAISLILKSLNLYIFINLKS